MDRSLPVPAPLSADPAPEIAALAERWKRANGPVIALLNRLGGSIESQLSVIPATVRLRIEAVTAQALEAAYGLARQGSRLPDTGGRGTLAAALATGAAGGSGGIATSVAELPFTITVLLHAIRREAARAGFDPDDPWIRAEALRTFGSGSPASADDGIDTSFLSARLTLTGPALQKLIATVAPRLAATLGQKVAAQAVPVLGAVSGAALNAAFLRYYREAAAIRFALLRLAEQHGAGPVLAGFAAATEAPKITRA
ncbi:MAG: EcsC family protein [Rhodobacteraceae bacterium]|nr:EcsC family protein [Paracoccaceae bacterium]